MSQELLRVRDLTISLRTPPGSLILSDVSFDLPRGTILGVVGGSGSGKTTLGLALLGLVAPAMRVRKGSIFLEGRDILAPDVLPAELRQLRGARVSLSFQEAASAFDPVFTVGNQIMEAISAHQPVAGALARRRMLDLLALVEIPDPVRVADSYPHELSGGLRQRAMLAMALAAQPALLVADEPTSSLDVILQARLMGLFRKLRRELGLAIVLIAHDTAMVRKLADEILILSRGRRVAADHPYALALLSAGEM
jgi:ABC-type glutathione transport system ATPase component